jgi:hypothetical protein
VRDGEVFLKTLTGLERSPPSSAAWIPILRSLEFRGDSALGVPGLVEAVRAGGVVLANALGGGVIRSPPGAYLPNICRALLGEDLSPDVATIWCGTEWGRKEACRGWIIPSCVTPSMPARFFRRSSARLGADLGNEERNASPPSRQRGETMVLQEISPLGLAPV